MVKYIYKMFCLTYCPTIYRRIKRLLKYNDKYKKMRQYKNIHQGERCFIVATGPSLTIEDIEKLDQEVSFGMNSGIYLMKKSNWQPTYYISQDFEVYQKLSEDIHLIDDKGIVKFIGDTATQNVAEKDVLYTVRLLNHLAGGQKIDFSMDCSNYIVDGWTVTYSAIQLAVYMGFKKIYLLGCDSNYSGTSLHAADCVKAGEKETTVRGSEFFKQKSDIAYDCAKRFSEKKGVCIYNCTRGGMLEVFERKDLDEVLAEKAL